MKNIHVLPTDKPSRLYSKDGNHKLDNSTIAIDWYISSAGYKPHNIYITSDEEISGFENNIWVIKGNRIFLWQNTMALVSNNKPKKIILTTDEDLINGGVQSIDDEFLEWFVKNPSCEEVEIILNETGNYREFDVSPNLLYKIIIPKEELTISDEAKQRAKNYMSLKGALEPKQETLEEASERYWVKQPYNEDAFIEGANWQAERMYSEEDLRNAYRWGTLVNQGTKEHFNEWFEQFKKK